MAHRVGIALAVTALLAASGCARSAKVSSVHVEQPGTHVISGHGAVSIARNTSSGSRVCTRLVPPSGKGRGGKPGPARGAEPGAQLDVLLFRLCEARGNGDISAEQYAASVQTILKTLEARAERPRVPVMRRLRERFRERRFGPGSEPPDPDSVEPPAAPPGPPFSPRR